MKIGASTLIAVGILNAVHAAPAHEGDRLECRAIGKPGTLAVKNEFNFNPRYMDMVDGTLKKLEKTSIVQVQLRRGKRNSNSTSVRRHRTSLRARPKMFTSDNYGVRMMRINA